MEPVLLSLWLERGGNLESLGNERYIVRSDLSVVYERGRGVEVRDPQHGKVIVGACDRYTFKLDEAAMKALRSAAAEAKLSTLDPVYRKAGAHDGSQAALLLRFADRTLVSSFDNELPAPYRAISDYLTKSIASVAARKAKAGRCDPSTWFFLTPPGDRR